MEQVSLTKNHSNLRIKERISENRSNEHLPTFRRFMAIFAVHRLWITRCSQWINWRLNKNIFNFTERFPRRVTLHWAQFDMAWSWVRDVFQRTVHIFDLRQSADQIACQIHTRLEIRRTCTRWALKMTNKQRIWTVSEGAPKISTGIQPQCQTYPIAIIVQVMSHRWTVPVASTQLNAHYLGQTKTLKRTLVSVKQLIGSLVEVCRFRAIVITKMSKLRVSLESFKWTAICLFEIR